MPQPSEPLSRAAQSIQELFDSGRPLIYIRTSEEQRVAGALTEIAAGTPIWTWSVTEGLRGTGGKVETGTHSPRAVLDFIAAHEQPAIFHLQDLHDPLHESSEIRRRLRDVYQSCLDQKRFVVITSPVADIPHEIERSLIFLDLRPPDFIELLAFLRKETSNTNEAILHQFARALQGLTLDEARYAVRRALTADPNLGPGALHALLEEKRMLINRSGVIEYIADVSDLEGVGGLQTLKKWLRERQKLFQMRDNLDSEIVPKGVLFMGIPGCGKSLCVKAIASAFQLPLYRVDMIEIFSGRHGKPEGAFVAACRMMEDIAPAVLWFDEIEMGITSTESSGEQGRIFAFFLTWMQEKTRGLFVAATANRIDLLPAEMIRKGRFDEVFFVDLPLEHEQIEIFKIHLLRRGIDPAKFNLEQLTKFTIGWAGAEIEQCVVSAITRARLDERELTEQDLINIAVKLVPLSRTMKEQISHIRAWAFERAVKASAQIDR
ncbi:MAG TPA: AAA family ATPase [Bryobacteraceae bacterium]|jgi:SpoVK/Ycf46/Vps4 family AAA+-type ATPase